jgi:hypothetical protein
VKLASDRRSRLAVAVVLLCLCALGNARMLQRALSQHSRSQGSLVERFLARFASLRQPLATEASRGYPLGTLGYLADAEHLGDGAVDPDTRFYLLQYALAPQVVERNTRHHLVVFDSDAADATPEIAAQERWTLIAEADEGLKLFRTGREH